MITETGDSGCECGRGKKVRVFANLNEQLYLLRLITKMRNLLLLRCVGLEHKRPGCVAEGSERHGTICGDIWWPEESISHFFSWVGKKDTPPKHRFKMTCIWVLTRFDNGELESDVRWIKI